MKLGTEQRGVVHGIVVGAVLTVLFVVGSPFIWKSVSLADGSAAGRLQFALKADVFVIIWLGIAIGALARRRFFTPADIDGSGLTAGTARARALQSVLQNTLEQVVLAVGVHLVWAVTMPARWLASLPVAVILFALGRVLFWRGYEKGAAARAVGFALTFYPSMLMLAIAAVAIAGQALGM